MGKFSGQRKEWQILRLNKERRLTFQPGICLPGWGRSGGRKPLPVLPKETPVPTTRGRNRLSNAAVKETRVSKLFERILEPGDDFLHIGAFHFPDHQVDDLVIFIQHESHRVRVVIQGVAQGALGVRNQGEGNLVLVFQALTLSAASPCISAANFTLFFRRGYCCTRLKMVLITPAWVLQ